MSCCDEQNKTDTKAPLTVDQIMAGLPQVMLAPSDPRHPLASSIRNSLPMQAGRYGAPAIRDDGTIEFTKIEGDPPPEINGYRRDPENPWLFWPLWNECQLRMAGVKNTTKGGLDLKMVCNNQAAPAFMKFVKPMDCASCTQRKNPA